MRQRLSWRLRWLKNEVENFLWNGSKNRHFSIWPCYFVRVFFCRELWKNFPKNPRKKCWSQSCEISNWNILQDFKRIFDNFFLPEIFQWHLKTPKDDRSVLLRVIVFRQRTVCYDVRHTWTRALPSVFVRRSIDVIILVFLGMASVWIQLQLLDQKNISVLAMEWLISRIWNQRRRLNRVLLLNYRRIC